MKTAIPALAFLWFDPKGDGDPTATALYFVHWDRAQYAWRTPVNVATVGNLPSQNLEPVSLAFDSRTGLAALAYRVEGHDGLTVAQSKDSGMTWQPAAITAGLEGAVASTSLALAAGRMYLVANSESGGVRYLETDPSSDPSGWKSQPVPPVSGAKYRPGTNVALALDGAGKPVVGFVMQPEDGSNTIYGVWRPGQSASVRAADSNNQGVDDANLSLAANGNRLGLLFGAPRDPKNTDASVWFAVLRWREVDYLRNWQFGQG